MHDARFFCLRQDSSEMRIFFKSQLLEHFFFGIAHPVQKYSPPYLSKLIQRIKIQEWMSRAHRKMMQLVFVSSSALADALKFDDEIDQHKFKH